MIYIISKGERILVTWLINQLEGVNRTDARLITKVEEHLELDDVARVPVATINEKSKFELVDLEVAWITDHINKTFDTQKMPPSLAKHALSLEDKLKEEVKKK